MNSDSPVRGAFPLSLESQPIWTLTLLSSVTQAFTDKSPGERQAQSPLLGSLMIEKPRKQCYPGASSDTGAAGEDCGGS